MLSRIVHAARVVLHDPQVDREGKALVAVLVARGVIAVGGTAASADLIVKVLQAAGV